MSAGEVHELPTGLPRGPRWPRLAQTAAWGARPLWLLDHLQRRYGDLFTLRTLGLGNVVVVADPALIKQVFTGDRDVFEAGGANAALGPVLGQHSLLLLDGERHLRQRRLLLPPFHGDAVRGYADLVAQIAGAEVDSWPLQETFAIRPRMQAVTLEVILRAVIGVRDERRRARLRTLLPQLLEFTPLDMWAVWIYPKLIDSRLGRRHQALRVRPEVDRLLATEIREHRDDPAGRDDVLALLVAARDEQGEALTDEELRDHVITLLLAGHETTATALAWCFERLLRHPTALARLRDELESGADEPYLDAVISETLRVRPVIDAVWRKLTAPAVVGDHVLPAGTVVMPAIALVQRSDAYDDADAFRPERFLGTSAPAYTFIPFGGGPRRCIGASFALMEMKAVLRAVLARVELSPAGDPEPARVHHITLVPARGGQVIATARRSAAGTGPTRPAVRDGGEPIPSAP